MSRRRPRHTGPRPVSPVIRLFQKLLLFLFFFAVLITTVFGIFWWMGDSFFQLKGDQNAVFVYSSLDGNNSQIFFIHFSKNDQRITVVPLQPSQTISVIGGYGEYQLGKVYPLLTLEKKSSSFIRAALGWGVGTVVDQVIPVNNPITIADKGDLTKLLQSQLFNQGLHPQTVSHLAELYFFTRSVPNELVTSKSQPVEIKKLADVLYQPLQADCSVAVVNTTPVAKLATSISSMLEKTGMTVVLLDDASTPYQQSTVSVDLHQQCATTIIPRLKAVFPDQIVVVDKPELRQEHRADVVIMIGQDAADAIGKK